MLDRSERREVRPAVCIARKKARLRDRMDSVIVHEYEEAKGVSHAEAVARAPDTELPVRRQVRDILGAMAEGETDRGRG